MSVRRPSTARRSGRTRTASRASSTTSATATRRGARPSAALGELEGGDALLFPSGTGAATARRARVPRAGHDDRARRGRVLRHVGALPRARALGPALRRVRPDRAAARRRRPRLARGAVEPVPDDARPRRGRARIRRRVLVDSTAVDARLPARARATAPTSSSTARRSTSAATTTCCSARSCAARPGGRGAPARVRTRPASSPPPSRRGCSSAASRRSSPRCAATPRPRPRSPSGSRAHERGRARPLPGLRRAALLRRRRRAEAARTVETRHALIDERDEPRRRALDARDAPPLGGRPRPAEPPPAERRARAGRGALGRPESGA